MCFTQYSSNPSSGGSGGGGSAQSGTGGAGMDNTYTPSNITTNGSAGNTASNNSANSGGNGICSWAGNYPCLGGGGGGAGGPGGTATTIQKVAASNGVTYSVNSDNINALGGNGIQYNSGPIGSFAPSGTSYGTYYWGSGGTGGGGSNGVPTGGFGGSYAIGGLNPVSGTNAGNNTGGGGAEWNGKGGSGIVILAFDPTITYAITIAARV